MNFICVALAALTISTIDKKKKKIVARSIKNKEKKPDSMLQLSEG